MQSGGIQESLETYLSLERVAYNYAVEPRVTCCPVGHRTMPTAKKQPTLNAIDRTIPPQRTQ